MDEVVEAKAPDGTTKRRLAQKAVLIEPGAQCKAGLEARLGKGKDLAVRFKLEV